MTGLPMWCASAAMNVNQDGGGGNSGVGFVAGKALHLENCTLVRKAQRRFRTLLRPECRGGRRRADRAHRAQLHDRVECQRQCLDQTDQRGPQSQPCSRGSWSATVCSASRPIIPRGSGKISVDFVQSVAKGNVNQRVACRRHRRQPGSFHDRSLHCRQQRRLRRGRDRRPGLHDCDRSTFLRNGTGLAQQAGSTVATLSNNTSTSTPQHQRNDHAHYAEVDERALYERGMRKKKPLGFRPAGFVFRKPHDHRDRGVRRGRCDDGLV